MRGPAGGPSRRTAKPKTPPEGPADKNVGSTAEISPEEPSRDNFIVVGIGGSAGGLEAFTELLERLPRDTGMAFVVVQHLDPRHKSSLAEILGRATGMPVAEAAPGLRLQTDHVYVMPAEHDLAMLHGVLHSLPRENAAAHMPIDAFFRSLAEDRGPRAIGVVLSGMGSDGALGLRAIKAEGGISFAQEPSTAKQASMPVSAAAIGVDFVLSPTAIAQELARIARGIRSDSLPKVWSSPLSLPEDELQKVFIMLRRATGVDFTYYKRSTVTRRVARRMVLHKIDTLRHYVRFLQQNPNEVNALFEDMLINVTSFFRDPESFETLKETVFPRLIEGRGREYPIRIWVPACSTGEEAYSLAIALVEFLGKEEGHWPIQIFATDISNEAIAKARDGRYPENIAADVSLERLQRFFVRCDGGYQISKTIRDLCVVAKQNLVKDPPFSNLDLISCRNLLIYMEPALQKRVIPTFHYALRPNGHLVLGSAETIGSFADLFVLADKKHKFYDKKPAAARLPAELGTIETVSHSEAPPRETAAPRGGPVDLDREVDRLILAKHPSSGIVVDGNMNIVHVRGQTGRYLEPAPGRATWNLAKMAREGLALDLRTAIHESKVEQAPVRREGLHVRYNGGMLAVSIEVVPFQPIDQPDQHFLILFEEQQSPLAPARSKEESDPDLGSEAKDQANRQLEVALNELAETKETLRTIIEQHEATNEELRAANEEIQSSNEELQSTNEELETAKEELQSTNEELTTLNEELESRNAELNQTINDYNNLLASVDIPILVLDSGHRIRLFTPMAASLLNLIPADRGRPVRELSLGAHIPQLERKIVEVSERLQTCDEEVQMPSGRWFALRMRPYRTADNRIDGVVLALVDVSDRKIAEQSARNAQVYIQAMIAVANSPLAVLDGEQRVIAVNAAFCETFGLRAAEAERKPFYGLGDGQWNNPTVRALLESPGSAAGTCSELVTEHEFPAGGRQPLLLRASRIEPRDGQSPLILVALEPGRHGSLQ